MSESAFDLEKKLIDEYKKVSKEIIPLQYLKDNLSDRFNETDEMSLTEKKQDKYQLEEKLTTVADRPLSLKKLYALISQFNAIIGELKEGRDGLSISGNQGLIFETAIYSFIIKDIEFALSLEEHMWSIPHYHFEKDGKFNYRPVKDLLQKYLEQLKKIDAPNYVLLESVVASCTEELLEMAREDYKRIYFSQF